MRYARIYDGLVVEFFETDGDITEMFHPSLIWVPIDGLSPPPEYNWTAVQQSGVWVLSAPVIIPPDPAVLAAQARTERERQLRSNYDPGIMMALRALRMATTPQQTAYAEGKAHELDLYAEALLAIPDQPGFPQTIVWPVVPTK